MDTNHSDEYDEFAKDPEKLLEHLSTRFEQMLQILDDDENFCNRDIKSIKDRVQIIENKFLEKTQELRNKLEQFRLENEDLSQKNKDQFIKEVDDINDLFSKDRYQAWKKFKDCEKKFQQRPTVIERLPKLHMNENVIEDYFSSNPKLSLPPPPPPPVTEPVNTVQSTIINTTIEIDDTADEIPMTNKEKRRKEKVIETVSINKDDEEVPDEKPEQIIFNSKFGIRSRLQESQSTTVHDIPPNHTPSPASTNSQSSTPTNVSSGAFRISNRLGASSSTNNPSFSGRKLTATPNNYQQPSPTPNNYQRPSPTPSSTFISISQQQTMNLNLSPVSHYQHERNILLLMACSPKCIVLFKSQNNRKDRWQLGAIERGSQNEHSLTWHDGLIISMGHIGSNNFYMFTEREIIIYSFIQRRKLNTRTLKHGNDDGYEINSSSLSSSSSSSEYDNQRGIGTVYDNTCYHIYLNRNSRWALSRITLNTLTRMTDIDLLRISDNVLRFIQLCVNENTINYLVQMDNLSYAVIFSSKNSFKPISSVELNNARQPLTICSAYIKSLKCDVFFVNDPSIDVLHILTSNQYLQSCSVTAHAICYVAEKHELMIVTQNSICSINLDNPNLFSLM